MCAEVAARVGRTGRREPFAAAWRCAAGGTRAVTWTRLCRRPRSPREAGGGRLGLPERTCWTPASRRRAEFSDPGSAAAGAGRYPECLADPSRARAVLNRTSSLACGQQPSRLGPHALFPWDTGELPTVDWFWYPPRRDVASIVPKSTGFPLAWSGNGELRSGRARNGLAVAARPASLGRGACRAPPALPSLALAFGLQASSAVRAGEFPV